MKKNTMTKEEGGEGKGRRRKTRTKKEEEEKGNKDKKHETYEKQRTRRQPENLQKRCADGHAQTLQKGHVWMVPLCFFSAFSMGGPETTSKTVFSGQDQKNTPKTPNASKFTTKYPLVLGGDNAKPLFL